MTQAATSKGVAWPLQVRGPADAKPDGVRVDFARRSAGAGDHPAESNSSTARSRRHLRRWSVAALRFRSLASLGDGFNQPSPGLAQPRAPERLQIDSLEPAAIPLHLVSLDLLSDDEVRLSSGSAWDAVLAATAIPGVLPAVAHDGRLLVDGGVVDNTPISQAIALGARRIYVLKTYDPLDRGLPAAPRGALDTAVHPFELLIDAREQAEIAHYATSVQLITLPAVNPDHVQPTDFDHADQLIHHGLLSARQVLDAAPTAGRARRRSATKAV